MMPARLRERLCTMRNLFVTAFILGLLSFGAFVGAVDAGGLAWGPAAWCVDAGAYSYDGYKPPPMYYRAYYGDTRICRRHYSVHVRRRVRTVHSRG